jgi:CHRD domain
MKRFTTMLWLTVASVFIVGAVAGNAAPPSPKKVALCHWTGKKYVRVVVGAPSFRGHIAHGADLMPAPQTCPSQQVPAARTGGRPLVTTLTGAAEVPGPGDDDGRGKAFIRLSPAQQKVCFYLTARNITLPAVAAHIHIGASTTSGPVVVGLGAPNASGVSFGCVSASADLIAAIRANPSNYYVNVHTTDFPNGAIRGQL